MTRSRSPITRIAATLIVAGTANWVVKQVFGNKAGVAGAVTIAAAHELFDAPLADYLSRAIAVR